MSDFSKLSTYSTNNIWKKTVDSVDYAPDAANSLYLLKCGFFLTGVSSHNASKYVVWNASTVGENQVKGIYLLEATSKGLPSPEQAESWTIPTDSDANVTGKRIIGKIPSLNAFEIQTPMPFEIVYGNFMDHAAYLDTFTVVFEYDDSSYTDIYQIVVPECKISFTAEGGENAGYAKTTFTCNPIGGPEANMPTLVKVTRS